LAKIRNFIKFGGDLIWRITEKDKKNRIVNFLTADLDCTCLQPQ